jgi:hypothetical protein
MYYMEHLKEKLSSTGKLVSYWKVVNRQKTSSVSANFSRIIGKYFIHTSKIGKQRFCVG